MRVLTQGLRVDQSFWYQFRNMSFDPVMTSLGVSPQDFLFSKKKESDEVPTANGLGKFIIIQNFLG